MPCITPEANPGITPWPVLAGVTLLTGVAAGLSGMLLVLLLHVVQHLAYSAQHATCSFGSVTISRHVRCALVTGEP